MLLETQVDVLSSARAVIGSNVHCMIITAKRIHSNIAKLIFHLMCLFLVFPANQLDLMYCSTKAYTNSYNNYSLKPLHLSFSDLMKMKREGGNLSAKVTTMMMTNIRELTLMSYVRHGLKY